jgi:uncharacterized lipoprotein YajG
MKKVNIFLVLCFACLLVLAGCSGQKNTLKTRLGKEVALSIGQQAVITAENVTVVFKDITQDSRCPSDVVCVQAGQVNVVLDLTINGESSSSELMGRMEVTSQQIGEYIFTFSVTPEPVSTKQIQKSEYRLHLTVTECPFCE